MKKEEAIEEMNKENLRVIKLDDGENPKEIRFEGETGALVINADGFNYTVKKG